LVAKDLEKKLSQFEQIRKQEKDQQIQTQYAASETASPTPR